MKCKHCNDGKTHWDGHAFYPFKEFDCKYCHGTGIADVSNEEFIRTCSTEELEHTLTMLIMKDRFFADKEFAYVNIRFGVHCWLKEKHT